MTKHRREHSAIALFSGGLDSILAVKWMKELGYDDFRYSLRPPICLLRKRWPVLKRMTSKLM